MINYRHLFNPTYNYVGIIMIIVLIIFIFINNRDINQSVQKIGIIITFSGLITLTLALLLNFFIDIILPQNYQLFIEVVSKNISKNCQTSSIVTILIGGTILIFNKIFLIHQKN